MKKMIWLSLLAMVIGCGSTPAGFKEVDPLVKPHGRAIAVLPFGVQGKAEPVDGLKLAINTAEELKLQLKGVKVLGPTELLPLPDPLNEASWVEIAKKYDVQLLVVGDISFIEIVRDKALQSQEGQVGIKFRVLEVSPKAAKPLVTDTTWTLSFPEEPTAKFDPIYGEMQPGLFRHDMLGYAGQKLAGIFFKHYEKTYPINTFKGIYREPKQGS